MFIVGYNTAGYLPEMEPWEFATSAEAKQALIDELLAQADAARSWVDNDDDESVAEDLAFQMTALAEDLNLSNTDAGWDGSVCVNLEHALPTSYWIAIAEPADLHNEAEDAHLEAAYEERYED